MIGYVTLGSNDLDKARLFYSALLGSIGGKELMRLDHGFTLYGTGMGKPAVALVEPYDGKAATVGNGVMVALAVDSRGRCPARQGTRTWGNLRRQARRARRRGTAGFLWRLLSRSRRQQALRLQDRPEVVAATALIAPDQR